MTSVVDTRLGVLVHVFEKYGVILSEEELDSLVTASAIVIMGLQDGLESESDNEELRPLARDLLASFMAVRFGTPISKATPMAEDFLTVALEGLA